MKTNSQTQPLVMYGAPSRGRQAALFSFVAAFCGMAVGFVAAVAVVLPAVHNDIAAQTKQLRSSLVSSVAANGSSMVASACFMPTDNNSVGGGRGLLGASANSPSMPTPSGGQGAGQPNGGRSGGVTDVPDNTYITNLIGGMVIRTASSIRDTGPHSSNIITNDTRTSTMTSNATNISVSTDNTQHAATGAAVVTDNTHAASAVTGDAINTNSTSLDLNVSNR